MTINRDDLKVKRAATGLGLFSLRDIPAGKRIIEYLGPIITSEEVYRRGGKYHFEIDENFSIDGSARTNLARYINHSCRPNAEAFVTGRRIWIWSKKDIRAGEQITIHYGKAYFDEHIKPVGCKCAPCTARAAKKTGSNQRSI